jgi:hypothetical protein
MHQDAFNKDFYVTAATVIPLFYLALTLQGQTFERIIVRSIKEINRRTTSWRQAVFNLISVFVLGLAGIVIVSSGIAGESGAILALYNQSSSRTTDQLVLLSLFVLLIAVVTGPAFRWAAPLFAKPSDESENRKAGKETGQP